MILHYVLVGKNLIFDQQLTHECCVPSFCCSSILEGNGRRGKHVPMRHSNCSWSHKRLMTQWWASQHTVLYCYSLYIWLALKLLIAPLINGGIFVEDHCTCHICSPINLLAIPILGILDKHNIVSFTYISHSLYQVCAVVLAHWHSATISLTSADFGWWNSNSTYCHTLHLSC